MLYLAGVDEAGRGPLAGPVVAAAVVLEARCSIDGLADSKILGEARREALVEQLQRRALAIAVASCCPREIEQFNIRRATQVAMERAALQVVDRLGERGIFLVDGNMQFSSSLINEAIVKGDAKLRCISAASIIAKVHRDREMKELDRQYPGYGLAVHKGYPTEQHRRAIRELGPSECHRRSFAGVRECLRGAEEGRSTSVGMGG